MEDLTTRPSLLPDPTVPVPLSARPQTPADPLQPSAPAATWPGLLLKLAVIALALWLLRRWWQVSH